MAAGQGPTARHGRVRFNPDQTAVLISRFNDAGASVNLYVRMKLQGRPEGDYCLGEFDTMVETDSAWQIYLAGLA